MKGLGLVKNKANLYKSHIPQGYQYQTGNSVKAVPSKSINWLNAILKLFSYTGIMLAVVLGLYLAIDNNLFWLFGKSPSISALENPELELASEVYTIDHKSLGKYYTSNRSPITYKRLSPSLVNALVATEDVRFYEHSGIDFQSLPSIVLYKLKGDRRGASTLTQQLAKNMYRTRTGASMGLLGDVPVLGTGLSKLKEWITAIKLERRFSKDELITMYLNTVDFGANSFGIKTACKTFFNTSPDSLTIGQCATLVGLLKAPTTYSPILDSARSKERRNIVLAQMLKYKKINNAQYKLAKRSGIDLEIHIENPADGPATYFRGVLNNELKEICKGLGKDLYTSGLKIYTTIDSKWQKHAEQAVQEQMKDLQKKFDAHWRGRKPWVNERGQEITWFLDSAVMRLDYYKHLMKKFNGDKVRVMATLNVKKPMKVFAWNPNNKANDINDQQPNEKEVEMSSMDSLGYYKQLLNAGFLAMDYRSGQVKAWVGGIDYQYFKFDHVKQSKRQPGSTFKPILYATALEKGDALHPNGYSPCDTIRDRQVTVRYIEHNEVKTWNPHNADGVFTGAWNTLRQAMAKSINSIAAQMSNRVGWVNVIEMAHKLGITSPLDSVPSVALGSSDVNVFEMVNAYCTFMNGGVHIEPTFIVKIEDRYGRVIYEPRPKRTRAMSEENAWLMTYMLLGGTREAGGTSQALFQRKIFMSNDIGGKTGTSSNHSDGWFMGVTKDLVAGTWVGGEDRAVHFRSGQQGEGSKTALPIFGAFIERMYKDRTTGVTMGFFPKPTVNVTKPHNCENRYRAPKPQSDSTKIIEGDSTTAVESIG